MTPEELMEQAIALSLQNVEDNQREPFGAVVVKNGEIIASGFNQVGEDKDPSSHAEIVAIRRACQVLDSPDLSGCELYTSCEPCPMCLGAVYWSGLDRVYYGCSKEDAAKVGFSDQFIYEELAKKRGDRQVPMLQRMGDEAYKVFEIWSQRPADQRKS